MTAIEEPLFPDQIAETANCPLDKLAREIYETWSGNIGYVPWVEGGNSLKQEDARRLAYKIHDAGMKLQRERDAVIDPDVLDFLMGIGPLEGCHFGEMHPTRKGAFWWRTVLRERDAMIKQEATQAIRSSKL